MQIEWHGLFPSFDRLAELLSDPGAAISSLIELIASLSRYATLDPSYFVDGVEALDALTFVISLVRLLATYGRQLFALVDTAMAILKTHMILKTRRAEAASDEDDGTAQVFEAVTDPSAVRAMDLLVAKRLASVQRLEDLAKETSFQWDEKGLNDGDMVTIAWIFRQPAFAESTVLTNLGLVNNNIGDEGAKALAAALRVNAVLKSLDVGGNEIGDEGAAAIAEALQGNEVLTNLNLTDNDIHNEGATVIAEALRGNGVLTTLVLLRNNIGDEGAKALASALRVNGVLKSIDLRLNNLGDEGEKAIRDAVSGREGFKLAGDDMTHEELVFHVAQAAKARISLVSGL